MSEAATLRGYHAPAGAAAARRALVEWVRGAGEPGRVFLQTHLRASGDRFEVRHVEDRDVPVRELESLPDPFDARLVAQTTLEGAHRPLKTSPNLRSGWRFQDLDERGLWTVLDYLYPAAVPHWHAGREGSLRVTHWADTASRQSGMYSVVRLLPERAVRDAVRACCADAVCLRRVAWGMSDADAAPIDAEGSSEASATVANDAAHVPCPEACSMFVSFARSVLAVERSPRVPLPGLGALNELELAQIRGLVDVGAGMREADAREGEFEEPLNQRRLRYLATRIGREAAGPAGDDGH